MEDKRVFLVLAENRIYYNRSGWEGFYEDRDYDVVSTVNVGCYTDVGKIEDGIDRFIDTVYEHGNTNKQTEPMYSPKDWKIAFHSKKLKSCDYYTVVVIQEYSLAGIFKGDLELSCTNILNNYDWCKDWEPTADERWD